VILQINGRGAASPEAAARLIRQIPIGQQATLTIWRDGDQQQLQVAMEPARESHQVVGYRGEGGAANGDLESRTMRLEQQLATITQELQQLRQDMMQLRGAGGQPAGAGAGQGLSAPPESPTPPQPSTNRTPPAPEKGGPPAAGTTDPFGSSTPPKTGAPKAGTEQKSSTDTDSLFK
jgi:hypothetical protein